MGREIAGTQRTRLGCMCVHPSPVRFGNYPFRSPSLHIWRLEVFPSATRVGLSPLVFVGWVKRIILTSLLIAVYRPNFLSLIMPKFAERYPAVLIPADSKKASHGLWRPEHQTTPLPSVAFHCFDFFAVGFNRFVSRRFQMRWVTE